MIKSRLKRLAEEGGMGAGSAVPIFFGNPEEIVDNNDEINKKQYAPSIVQPWTFEQPMDYAENQLIVSKKISRLKNN
ncbi:hypothetical protein D3C87_76230 [compost metagenome]